MKAYPDASLLVSAYVDEPASDRAERWLRSLAPGDLASSAWSRTEVASALAKKVRMGALTLFGLESVFGAIQAMLADSAIDVPVEPHHFATAADLVVRSPVPLRAGDALHLAIAAGARVELVTLDRRMAEAGQALGLDTRLLA